LFTSEISTDYITTTRSLTRDPYLIVYCPNELQIGSYNFIYSYYFLSASCFDDKNTIQFIWSKVDGPNVYEEYSKSTGTLIIKNNLMTDTNYTVQLTLNVFDSGGNQVGATSKSCSFTAYHSDPIAIIYTDYNCINVNYETLTVDSSYSYPPSLNVVWSCTEIVKFEDSIIFNDTSCYQKYPEILSFQNNKAITIQNPILGTYLFTLKYSNLVNDSNVISTIINVIDSDIFIVTDITQCISTILTVYNDDFAKNPLWTLISGTIDRKAHLDFKSTQLFLPIDTIRSDCIFEYTSENVPKGILVIVYAKVVPPITCKHFN
jgi:hypothetical protein